MTLPDEAAFTAMAMDGRHEVVVPGLTKREYFAIHILAGSLSDPNCEPSSEWAVKRADELIAELNKPKT